MLNSTEEKHGPTIDLVEENECINEPATVNPSCKGKKGKKTRKEQSEEDYIKQKLQFYQNGPTLNTEDWLYDDHDLEQLDNERKTDRVRMLHACEKAYYQKDYNKCLDLISKGEILFGVNLDNENENEEIKNEFEASGKKTRKSAKVDRHIVELLHIKESCLEKLNS